MQRLPVESSSIVSIGYAPQERVLELEFRQSGEVYQYFDVPAEDHAAFLQPNPKALTSINSSSLAVTATSEFSPRSGRLHQYLNKCPYVSQVDTYPSRSHQCQHGHDRTLTQQ